MTGQFEPYSTSKFKVVFGQIMELIIKRPKALRLHLQPDYYFYGQHYSLAKLLFLTYLQNISDFGLIPTKARVGSGRKWDAEGHKSYPSTPASQHSCSRQQLFLFTEPRTVCSSLFQRVLQSGQRLKMEKEKGMEFYHKCWETNTRF